MRIVQCQQVLRALAQWNATQLPPSIAAVEESLLLRTRPIFNSLFGVSDMPFSVRTAGYYVDKAHAGRPPGRSTTGGFSAPAAEHPSWWTQPIMKTGTGVLVRAGGEGVQ